MQPLMRTELTFVTEQGSELPATSQLCSSTSNIFTCTLMTTAQQFSSVSHRLVSQTFSGIHYLIRVSPAAQGCSYIKPSSFSWGCHPVAEENSKYHFLFQVTVGANSISKLSFIFSVYYKLTGSRERENTMCSWLWEGNKELVKHTVLEIFKVRERAAGGRIRDN